MKKDLAIFDFDGTITTRDTFLEFIKYFKGKLSYSLGLLILSPYIILFKLNLISSQFLKEAFLQFFFLGETEKKFNEKCDRFANDIIPSLVKRDAIREIETHINKSNDVVIISASLENYIKPWADKHNCKIIATKIGVSDSSVTGRIYGENCNGSEKVIRLNQEYNLRHYNKIHAYGNSKGDKEILNLADFPYLKKFTGNPV